MVRPHQEGKNTNCEQRTQHRHVTENGLAGIHRQDLRYHAHRRQQNDVYFRVAQEPEQVLIQDRTTTLIGQDLSVNHDITQVEAGAEVAVEQQEDRTGKQHGEGQYAQHGRKEHRPDGKRQARHAHAFGTHVQDGGDIVQSAQQRRDDEQGHTDQPKIGAEFLSVTGLTKGTERRIHRPTTRSRSRMHKNRTQHHHTGQEEEPVRKHVQERRGHVARTYLQRNEQVRESSAESGGQHKEYEYGSVNGHQSVIEFRLDLSAFGPLSEKRFEDWKGFFRISQLETEEHGEESANNGPHDTRDQELLPDRLVVHTENILRHEGLMMMLMCLLMRVGNMGAFGDGCGCFHYFTHTIGFI